MEHRCGARYPVDMAVYARAHAGVVSFVGRLENVSLSGGFLRTNLPVQPLSHISIRLIDDDGPIGPRLEGQVVRCDEDGLGIEWSEYAPELIRALGPNSDATTDRDGNSQAVAHVDR